MNTRRTFIKQSGLLTAGLMMNPSDLLKKQKTVGIQLYSVRDEIVKDPKGVLQKVAAAGYNEVEMYGLSADNKFYGLTVKELARVLKDNNLKTPSGHYAPEKFLFDNGNGDDVKNFCEVGHTLGNKYIIIPYLKEEKRKTIDQYKALADRINKAAEICKQAGLQLAYHNHDFEFIDINGEHGYDIFLNNTDKDLVKMEMDLYWVVRAGYDPVELFKKHPGRFPFWHVKDMDKADKTKNTEVGNGTVDFKTIFANAKLAGVQHYMVEQENNYKPEIFSSIKTSCSYTKTTLLK
ncbi:sugar phosphate isomerase/epimerase family protein [Ferruginibacter sp. SUN106]|uniref:sugar phosphate isomerase/epimerase family protein n=1 Tax=Ferruginibacter sp. SUN106 TaxID=2978348 RepID=UPI003D36E77C